jgi:LacI family transcriptional regulator
MGVLAAIRQAGLRMPHDVSLIGFDDSDWATVMVPSITVIAQPVLELGTRAAKRLLDRIAGDAGPYEVQTLETRLVFRESTGPPGGQSASPARVDRAGALDTG